MNFGELNDDVYYLIFSKINDVFTKLFMINKKFFKLRRQILIQDYSRYYRMSKKREPLTFTLLRNYKIINNIYDPKYIYNVETRKNEINTSRLKFKSKDERMKINITLHIISFIANKNRKEMKYACSNSYHRKLAHELCEAQNLLHTTIVQQKSCFDNPNICRWCKSVNIYISENYCYDSNDDRYKNGYHIYCKDCKNNRETKCISDSTKVILITKK